MRTLGTRRAVLVAGAATVAAVAACRLQRGPGRRNGAQAAVDQGVNQANPDGWPADPQPRRSSTTARRGTRPATTRRCRSSLYNQTTQPITVTVSSSRPTDGTDVADNGTASSVVLIGANASASPGAPAIGGSPTPTVSPVIGASSAEAPEPSQSVLPGTAPSASAVATPAAPEGQPAKLTLTPLGASQLPARRPPDPAARRAGQGSPAGPGGVRLTFTVQQWRSAAHGGRPGGHPGVAGLPRARQPRREQRAPSSSSVFLSYLPATLSG